MKKYYKFRTLDNIERIQDIIVNHRLYMSNYQCQGTGENRDYHEGHYVTRTRVPQGIIDSVKAEKQNLMICSVTDCMRNRYMWDNYADQGKGICIAFTIDDRDTEGRYVKYRGELVELSREEMANKTIKRLARDILSHKLVRYKVEREYRLLKESEQGSDYVNIKISSVCFGWDIDPAKAALLRSLIKCHYGNSVMIRQLRTPIGD